MRLPTAWLPSLLGCTLALALGCAGNPSPLPPEVTDGGQGDAGVVDAGQGDAGVVDAGTPRCQLAIAPPCCDATGTRLGGAECAPDGGYQCAQGGACDCGGQALDFVCTDFCGSDGFVDATCSGSGWECAANHVATNTCPGGACWGDPGECCINPSCVEGFWTCESIRDPCL